MAEKKLITDKLLEVQAALVAPKGQTNTFGKYKYRSCEDILEALKPLLKKAGLTLVISDEIVLVGGVSEPARFYVKATVKIADAENTMEVTAYAREAAEKKGMDAAQITGAASSYARKYALNGMFLIDDTRDADTMDNSAAETKTPAKTTTKPRPAAKPAGKGTAAQQSVGAEVSEKPATASKPRAKGRKPDPESDSMLEQRAAAISDTFNMAEEAGELKGLAAEFKPEIELMPDDFQAWLRNEFASCTKALKANAKRAKEGGKK